MKTSVMMICLDSTKKNYSQGNALIRKFYMCTECVKITLFKSFCSSLCLNTRQLWWNYKSESIRKHCVAYNNVFRLLCDEPRLCSASPVCVTGITHLQNANQEFFS